MGVILQSATIPITLECGCRIQEKEDPKDQKKGYVAVSGNAQCRSVEQGQR